MTILNSILKSRGITLPTKVRLVKAMVFPVVIWMWELYYKKAEHWRIWFWSVVLEKTLESPLDCKETQPVHPKRDQSWVFIGRTGAETKTPIHCIPVVNNWLICKDPDAGKDWRQEQKGMTEDEMVGRHYQLYGHRFDQAPGVGNEQRSLVCCSPWDHKESDMTEQLNWTELWLHWGSNWINQYNFPVSRSLNCKLHFPSKVIYSQVAEIRM